MKYLILVLFVQFSFGYSFKDRCLSSINKFYKRNFVYTKVSFEKYVELKAEAVSLAMKSHSGQIYDQKRKYAYSFHLQYVESVLRRFGFDPRDSEVARKLLIAAWLHDIIEDTPVTYKMLQKKFGQEIADLVAGVTNQAKNPSVDSQQRWLLTLKKMKSSHHFSVILKLADRIANVEFGKSTEGINEKYFWQFPLMKKTLLTSKAGKRELAMWKYLEELLS